MLYGALLAWLSVCVSLAESAKGGEPACPMVKIQTERLPDLQIPRSGHCAFCVNGELVVAGGHTSGYVPTPTAEYFSGGEWHLVNMVYHHDAATSVMLKSGMVMLAGGFEKHLGIGQTFGVEMYDPATHTFEGMSCLDHKRASARGIELGNGKVAITGNWYADDAIEYYEGEENCSFGKAVSQQRTFPYIFRTDSTDAIVFSGMGTRGERLDTIIIDRLQGESFQIPLFDTWKPSCSIVTFRCEDSFIGDEAKGIYSYLFPVEDRNGQMAIARTLGTDITLLPTTCPVPMQGKGGMIEYYTPVIADQKAQCGYVVGIDADIRHYVLRIDYARTPAPLTLYYTDPIPDVGGYTTILTDEGDLVFVGGSIGKTLEGRSSTNFRPLKTAILLRLGSQAAEASRHGKVLPLLVILLVAIIALVVFILRKRKSPTDVSEGDEPMVEPQRHIANEQLLQRIGQLMEERQLFLRPGLKVSDLAAELNTNHAYISDCIKTCRGCTFSQFVNEYRVAYAKQLLRQNPDIKLSALYFESGFTSESSFFRIFKAITGMTPKDWASTIDSQI